MIFLVIMYGFIFLIFIIMNFLVVVMFCKFECLYLIYDCLIFVLFVVNMIFLLGMFFYLMYLVGYVFVRYN